ncbi:MAG TPA: hypothetical protein VNI34_08610 [Candidatus Nitrosotalea sp.]|nr:hypothetical protein [Candidatus Nitrosotalea sp.]
MPPTQILVTPDFTGLPPSLVLGLTQLSDNSAALLTLVSGLGIGVSLTGMLLASWTSNPHLGERFKSALALSVGALALLHLGVLVANYSARLFA